MERSERIRAILTQSLNPSHIEVKDESTRHTGHAGAQPGGQTHYAMIIKSEAFVGLNKIKRHQMIYALLADEFKTGLHALSIKASAPEER